MRDRKHNQRGDGQHNAPATASTHPSSDVVDMDAASTGDGNAAAAAAVAAGYNSGDEADPRHRVTRSAYASLQEEQAFRAMLERQGYELRHMREDGNCLFRAVADQLYGDAEMHANVRRLTLDYMARERDHFSQFVTEDFDAYLDRKRRLTVYGNHTEIQAMCELFNRPIEVYSYAVEPINIFHGEYSDDSPPIRLSYHRSEHYNSVVDPNAATIGVGLGLPGLDPGAADRNLVNSAVAASENEVIEKDIAEAAIMEDVLRESLATYDAEAVSTTTGGGMDDEDALEEELIKAAARASEAEALEAVRLASEAEWLAQAERESAADIERQILEASRAEYMRQVMNSFGESELGTSGS